MKFIKKEPLIVMKFEFPKDLIFDIEDLFKDKIKTKRKNKK